MIEPERMRRLLADHDPSASRELRASLDALPSRDRDGWFDSVLGVDAFEPDGSDLPRGCVPYLPCSVDVILRTVDRAPVTSRDVFVDIGSGVGRAAALAHFLTGAATIGIEIQGALARRSQALAQALNVSRFSTVEGDATELVEFIQIGTVFFMYCPFGGARLDRVLDHLREIANTRPIRVCCVQLPALGRAWLEPVWVDDELSIYCSPAVERERAARPSPGGGCGGPARQRGSMVLTGAVRAPFVACTQDQRGRR